MQLFKTSCLTTKRGELQLSYILTYFYTFSLGKTNDFVLTSLKAATLIFPQALKIFFKSFTLKCPTNPHKKYSNVASAVPVVIF